MSKRSRKNKKLTPEQEKEIVSLYLKGYPESQIVKDFQISHWKVYNSLDKNGVERIRKFTAGTVRTAVFNRLTGDDILNVIKAYDEGYTYGELVAKFNLVNVHTAEEIINRRKFFTKKYNALAGLDNVDAD